MFDGQPYYLNFTSSSRRYATLEPFSERILSPDRQKRSTKGNPVTDYVLPANYAQIQEEEKAARAQMLRGSRKPVEAREKRQTTAPQYMELAVYVDQAVYDFFAVRYTGSPAEVRTKVLNYINGVLDSVQILYQLSSISPTVNFKISKLDIWNNQPSAVPVPGNLDAFDYLVDFCTFASPLTNQHDHATLLTGLDLQFRGSTSLGGLANLGSVCTNTACSLAKTMNNGFNAAYLLAHELGHGLNMVGTCGLNQC